MSLVFSFFDLCIMLRACAFHKGSFVRFLGSRLFFASDSSNRGHMFRKSPFSLPPEQYGGARKRVFIGLMLASCLLLCLGVAFFLILPWVGFFSTQHWLPTLSMGFGFGNGCCVKQVCLIECFLVLYLILS